MECRGDPGEPYDPLRIRLPELAPCGDLGLPGVYPCGAKRRRSWEARGSATKGSYVGVSLTLEFGTDVGGVSSFTIVPAELARSYTHNAPLPEGSVQGLAWETSLSKVALATNRNNQLMSGKQYVVFLSWPRETIPVAILDLPPVSRDYSTTLQATLDGAGVLEE